jgi:hypothetical protein
MKKLLALVLFLIVATICSAQMILEKNKDGEYRLSAQSEIWKSMGITVETEAQYYIDLFDQAISNPGQEIIVEKKEEVVKLKPIFKKLVKITTKKIVYDDSSKTISFIEPKFSEKEEDSYLILFALASIVFMILSNILFKKNKIAAVAVAAAAAAVAAAAAFAVFAAFAAAAAVAVAESYKEYYISSIIYYILMVIYLLFLFI